MRAKQWLCYGILILAIAACSKSPGAPAAQVLQAAIIDGDNQVDTVGQLLPTAIVTQVADKLSAQSVGSVVINWFRIVGTDTVFLGAGLTDGSGTAKIRPTLATKAGDQNVIAWALDADGDRAVHADAALKAVADRATHTQGFRVDTVVVHVGDPVLDNVSNAAAYDQYANYAGPLHWVAAAGWTVSADTAWATQAGVTDMQLVLDDAHAHVVIKVLP